MSTRPMCCVSTRPAPRPSDLADDWEGSGVSGAANHDDRSALQKVWVYMPETGDVCSATCKVVLKKKEQQMVDTGASLAPSFCAGR